LEGKSGDFTCRSYQGPNPLYRHGSIRVSEDGHHLVHADKTPFFWLADTVWGGALLSDDRGWDTYLEDRAAKHFTALQLMGTQFVASGGDLRGRQAFAGREKIIIDPFFFQRLDRRFDAANERGLVVVPAFTWAGRWDAGSVGLNPGGYLPEDQLVVL